MHDPRLIPLKTMTSDILKVSRTAGVLRPCRRPVARGLEMTRECPG